MNCSKYHLNLEVLGEEDDEGRKLYLVRFVYKLKTEFKGKITERDIIEWAKEKKAAYQYPRHVEFLNVLPRTAVGRIFRTKLRDQTF